MTGQLDEIIRELERRRRAIDRALAALRGVEELGSSAPETAASKAIIPPVKTVRKGNKAKQPDTSQEKHSTVEKAGAPPPSSNAAVLSPSRREPPIAKQKQAKKLTAGTMKARTVELLQTVGKPMRSGEVAKRMKSSSAYASVNLSQLRRD